MTTASDYDLVIIGGGINGAGIARDAAGRGLRVLLCEQADLANHTSSASTKLIHGGLRYLEHYEFRLVREALKEREVLLRNAPHVIWPLRFVMPHVRGLRPVWMIRAGLFLYDHLGGREQLPGSTGIDLRHHPAGAPLAAGLTRGFVYSDCQTQDARLVVLNAVDAAQRGAAILPRTRCVAATGDGNNGWRVTLESTLGGHRQTVRAAALVNAGGPWVSQILTNTARTSSSRTIQLVKGSHIVLPRLYDHPYAYIFQHGDGRVIFAIPYEDDYTLIGTTDVAYSGDPAAAVATREEIAYLCETVGRYFSQPITPDMVISTYAGVRALYDEHENASASAVSRDYLLDMQSQDGAPLLSVLGGKITTYRTLAEHAVDQLCRALDRSAGHWTATAPLPGGDLPDADLSRFLDQLRRNHPWLPYGVAWRLARTYGTRIESILGGARCIDDLGRHFGHGLYAVELRYLVDHEWAMTADDVLWRRTKLGLKFDTAQAAAVADWLAGHDGATNEQRCTG